MTDAHCSPLASHTPPHLTHRHMLLPGLLALFVLALPVTSAIYIEGEAPHTSEPYVQADVAPPDDPLANPLNLTMEELENLSGRAADAIRSPGVLLNMTAEVDAGFQSLMARLEQGGHDGIQVNGTGYRLAVAMAEIFATGTPDADGPDGVPAHGPNGDDTDDDTETGEASGIAIGTLTLVSAGAMYWIRRLA